MKVFDAVLLAIIASSIFYDVLTTALLRRWRKRQKRPHDAAENVEFSPVTMLRPVKRGVPGLAAKLADLVAAARPGDQVLVGVEDEESLAIARSVSGVEVIRCAAAASRNPKIIKLAQLTPHAQHERWIISDCESLITREFLDELRTDWRQGEVVTSGYRFVGARTLPERLDHSAALLSLWPGLMLAPRRFTLGACTGLHRADLEAIGGWDTLADYLAEDSRLGVLLTKARRRIIFSRAILPLEGDRVSWRGYLRHQLRVALTYRVSAPAGYFGMALTHGVTASLLLLLSAEGAHWAWLAFAAAWGVRTITAAVNARALKFSLRALPVITLLHSVMESACWLASWFSSAVYWNGRLLRISRRGVIEPELTPNAGREPVPAGDPARGPRVSYPAEWR